MKNFLSWWLDSHENEFAREVLGTILLLTVIILVFVTLMVGIILAPLITLSVPVILSFWIVVVQPALLYRRKLDE